MSRADPGRAGPAHFAPGGAAAPGAGAGLSGPADWLPVPGPHPSQDDGERTDMGGTGTGTPLVLGAVALLLCGAGLARLVHGRRTHR